MFLILIKLFLGPTRTIGPFIVSQNTAKLQTTIDKNLVMPRI